MTDEWPTGTKFIEEWFGARSGDEDFNQEVLALIARHSDGGKLDEAGLLDALVSLADEEQQNNGSG